MRPLGSDPCQIRTTPADNPDRTLGLSCARPQMTVSPDVEVMGGAASYRVRVVTLLALETDPHLAPRLTSAQRRGDHGDAASRADRRALVVHTGSMEPRAPRPPRLRSLSRASRGNDTAEVPTPRDPAIVIGPGPRSFIPNTDPSLTRTRAYAATGLPASWWSDLWPEGASVGPCCARGVRSSTSR